MTYSPEDWRSAITNLIKKTSNKEATWSLSDLYKPNVWTEVDRSYECSLGDKKYVVSATRKRYYLDEIEYAWESHFDFSIFASSHGEYYRMASAPDDLNVTGQLYQMAEESFAFSSSALSGLL